MAQGIEITRLSLRYSDGEGQQKTILSDLSLVVEPGELVLLSGYSGCGKSTLLNCINGVLWNDQKAAIEGKIYICGQDVGQHSVAELSRTVGSVLQNPESQIFNTECIDEISFGLRNLGLSPGSVSARVAEWAKRFDLDPGLPTAHLSGGQIQRLILASVLAMDAPILLLDEPFAHLDHVHARKLLHLLNDLAAQGKAIILVEHRIDLVLPYIDRMLWMDQGHIVEDLNKEEAQTRFGHCFRWFPQDLVGYSSGQSAAATPEAARTVCTVDQLLLLAGKDLRVGPISFNLEESQILTITGDNGTGKTTLLRTLCGLHHAQAGRCSFYAGNDKPLPVGLVFQNPSYQLFMNTVRAELSCHSKDPVLRDSLVQMLGLGSLLDRHPVSLSEGQKRILTIAAVAAADPSVLLLDEPTVGQDHAGFSRILDTLEFMRTQRRTAIILVTHDQRCLEAFAGQIMVLKDGALSTTTATHLTQGNYESPIQEELVR